MSGQWQQVGTVQVLQRRIYPIDPTRDPRAICVEVVVEPGYYPVYRKCDAFIWIMRGQLNERNEKIGDGLFSLNGGDVPGLEVQFPSGTYGVEQLAEFLEWPVCRPGPEQRLRFDILFSDNPRRPKDKTGEPK